MSSCKEQSEKYIAHPRYFRRVKALALIAEYRRFCPSFLWYVTKLIFLFQRLIAELNKEQEAFIASKQAGEKGEAVAPWVGAPNEDALREECLSLSTVSDFRFLLSLYVKAWESFEIFRKLPVVSSCDASQSPLKLEFFYLCREIIREPREFSFSDFNITLHTCRRSKWMKFTINFRSF